MNYNQGTTIAQQTRLAWIERYAATRGHIRRKDVAAAFGLSLAQASADIQRLLEIAPNLFRYSLNDKTYYHDGRKRYVTRIPEAIQFLSQFDR